MHLKAQYGKTRPAGMGKTSPVSSLRHIAEGSRLIGSFVLLADTQYT